MTKFETKEEAFASLGFDPGQVEIIGAPARHLEALKAFLNLCVAHDAVNAGFKTDWEDYEQWKYSASHKMGDASGEGFVCNHHDLYRIDSVLGSRLSSESREASEHISELCADDYKTMKVYDRHVEGES